MRSGNKGGFIIIGNYKRDTVSYDFILYHSFSY